MLNKWQDKRNTGRNDSMVTHHKIKSNHLQCKLICKYLVESTSVHHVATEYGRKHTQTKKSNFELYCYAQTSANARAFASMSE